MSSFKKLFAAFITAGALALGWASGAAATQVDFSNPAFAPTGKATSIPVGAAQFCKTHKPDCARVANPIEAQVLDEARWEQLVAVNNAINTAIIPETDEAQYKVAELWTYPDGFGDCEDYALAKRKALIEDGWNPSTLMIAVVMQANGEGHAVLMARTDRGDLVLDNQDGRVLVWNQTPYQYLKRQSQANAASWVDIVDDRATTVASR